MATPSSVALFADRVEKLLTRFTEQQLQNDDLRKEIIQLRQERDDLLQRLQAARVRVDALMARIPHDLNSPD